MISLPDRSTTPQSSEEVKLQELNFSNYQTSLQVPILKKPSNQITDNISMDEVKLYPMDTTMSDAAAGEDLQSDISPMLQKSIKPTTEAGLKTTSSIEKLSDEIQASSYAATTVITETNEPKASKKSTKPTKSSIQNSVPTKIQGELGDAVNQLLQLHDPELLNTQTTNQPSLLKKSSNKKPKKSLQPTDNSEMKIDQSNAVVNSTVPAFLQNSIDLSSVTAANGDQLPVSSLVDDDIEMKESSTIIPLSTSSLNNSSKPSSKDVSIPGKSKKAKKKNNNSKTPLNTDSKNSMSTESTLLYSSEKAEKSSLSSRQVVKNNSNNVQIPDSGNSTTSKKVSKTPIHPSPEQHISVSKMKVSPPRPKDKKLQLKKQKSKKSKLDNVLHQMNSLNDKTGGKLKKSDGVDDTTTTTNINDKESQENTRKRRFPRSYATQVDPSSIRSARRAAKRRKTDKPAEEKHDDSSEKPDQKKRKRTIKRRRNQIMKKWCIRSSLRESGVIVILLAGRHRGKRVVCLGRHKSSGLLLVTGPYRYNGCPLRRVHPNYVIATKTKIDLSNLSLPNRIHQKEYFARSTSPISRKSRKVNNQKRLEDILEHGVESQKPVYKPSEEKKSDQRFIDEEVRKAIKSHSDSQMLIRYLRSLFSISKHDRPHEMFF
uniref:Large ribosomal subunit protein eL6 n=1 Tax=Trichobilharzia regenti TaxID=157069 RepID=A0AA85J7T1_TRIRE|nr:unnamed protein product [Trichobilharzia regenti]